jgi:hypothetical protein
VQPKKKRYLWPWVAKIAIDVVIPTAGYYGLRAMGVAQVVALCLTAVPAVVYFLYRKARGQQVGAFETLLLMVVAASNTASLINGTPRITLSMDGWVSYGLAAACFISMSTRRPLVFLLVKSLLDATPLRVKHGTDQWDALWESEAWFRKPWRVSTVVWGVLNVITGSIRLGIAFFVPVDLAPLLLSIMTLEIVVVTQVWQTLYLKWYFKKHGAFPADDVAEAPEPPAPRVAVVEAVGVPTAS